MPTGTGTSWQAIPFIYYLDPVTTSNDTWTLSWTGAGSVDCSLLWGGFAISKSGTNPKTITISIDTAGISNYNSSNTYTGNWGSDSGYVKGSDGNYYFCFYSNGPGYTAQPVHPTTDPTGCYWWKVTTGQSVPLIITINSLPVSNIKLYRTSYGPPSDHTTGDYSNFFDPQLINTYEGYGTIRFMQWGGTEGSTITNWSNRSVANHYSCWGANLDYNWYCGVSSQTKNAYTGAQAPVSNPSSWT